MKNKQSKGLSLSANPKCLIKGTFFAATDVFASFLKNFSCRETTHSHFFNVINGQFFNVIRGLRPANLDPRVKPVDDNVERECVTSSNDNVERGIDHRKKNTVTFKGLDVVRQYAALFERRVQSSTRVRKAQVVTRQTNPIGRSMIEMLGVLAIIAVLSVGGIAGYGKAMEKFKLTKALDDYSMLINGLIEYKDNIRKIKTNDSLYGLVNIVQSLNLVPKTWKKVSAMHISDNYGNVLRIYSNNMDSENVFYVIDFYLGGTKISDKGSEVSPDFSSKLCLNLMTNLIVPLETAISSVNIWHTPDTSHAIGISKSKFYDLNYLHYACNSCGQDEACAISVIFKY